MRESMESPKFNSLGSRKSSLNPNGSKDRSFNGLKEELDFATAQFNRQGSDMFRKRSHMFSFDGENTSSIKSKNSSINTNSKKSSDNSLISNKTIDLPNTPNFNPTWKRTPTSKTRRRFAHIFKKSYFKKLSKIMETPEETKEDETLLKLLNRGSTLKIKDAGGKVKPFIEEGIDGKCL